MSGAGLSAGAPPLPTRLACTLRLRPRWARRKPQPGEAGDVAREDTVDGPAGKETTAAISPFSRLLPVQNRTKPSVGDYHPGVQVREKRELWALSNEDSRKIHNASRRDTQRSSYDYKGILEKAGNNSGSINARSAHEIHEFGNLLMKNCVFF